MRKPACLFVAFLLAALVGVAQAGEETLVTAAATGVFPPDTTFAGVPIGGLELAFALELEDGSGLGELSVTLLGVGGQRIVIEGVVTGGLRTGGDSATFSGTCSVTLVEGLPPTPNVPFTATLLVDANDQGTLGLVIGDTTLPNALVDAGSMTVSVPRTITPPAP